MSVESTLCLFKFLFFQWFTFTTFYKNTSPKGSKKGKEPTGLPSPLALHLSSFLSPGQMTSFSLKPCRLGRVPHPFRGQAWCIPSILQWYVVHASNYSIDGTDCNCWLPCWTSPCLFLLTSEQGAWPRAEWAIKCGLNWTSPKFLILNWGCVPFTQILLVQKILPACVSPSCASGVLYRKGAEETWKKWQKLLSVSAVNVWCHPPRSTVSSPALRLVFQLTEGSWACGYSNWWLMCVPGD